MIGMVANSQNNVLFENATKAYNNGKYEDAVENYLKILENEEHSASLYYNLGNSYYKLNQIAPSIYYYEKALLLTPNDSEIKNNLSFARNMALDSFNEIPENAITKMYSNIVGKLSFDQWSFLAVGLILLFVFSYIAFYYFRYPFQKRAAFVTSIFAIISAVIVLFLAYMRYDDFKSMNPAIIFVEEVTTKSEPNNRSTPVFTLHEGAKVNVTEELNNWKKIELIDGKTGWIPEEDLKLIKDF